MLNHIKACGVLVVGGDTAGCFVAIKAAEKGQHVILVDKGYVGRSGCSPFVAGALNVC
jgi:succinate dehydrogenase/fumarate reductase flavoprotein subunit